MSEFYYTLPTAKVVPDVIEYIAALQSVAPSIAGIKLSPDNFCRVVSTQELYEGVLSSLESVVPPATPIKTIVKKSIKAAIEFGNDLILDIAADNVLLGITQAGMTASVAATTSNVIASLQTGSLYAAIDACRAIPTESKDGVFITDARLLEVVNKIESYLGLDLSTAL